MLLPSSQHVVEDVAEAKSTIFDDALTEAIAASSVENSENALLTIAELNWKDTELHA